MKKTKEIERYLQYQKKIRVVKFAQDFGAKEACEVFKITKTTFYNWKKKFDKQGEEGLLRQKRKPESFANRIDPQVVELILALRDEHKLGAWRIKWYLERYHDVNVSESSVYRTLKRNNKKALKKIITRKAMATKRYEKEVPGHHVQIDVIKERLLQKTFENLM